MDGWRNISILLEKDRSSKDIGRKRGASQNEKFYGAPFFMPCRSKLEKRVGFCDLRDQQSQPVSSSISSDQMPRLKGTFQSAHWPCHE